MELRHLRYFLAVAEELSFVKAAETLFISQPPLSRQIKELEDEIGTALFVRNNKRVELTDAGKYFAGEVREMISTLEKIKLKAKKIGDNISGEFRIAYISSTFSGNITKLVKFLTRKYPYVNFRLYEVPTTRQIDALERGKIDLGIVRGPLNSSKLETHLWFKDSFSVVYHKDLLTLGGEKEFRKMKEQTFIFYNKDYAPHYYDTLLQICSKHGFTPKVIHESNNVNSILQLVSDGLGASILPTTAVKNYVHKNIAHLELKSTRLYSEVLLAVPRDEQSVISRTAVQFLIRPTK